MNRLTDEQFSVLAYSVEYERLRAQRAKRDDPSVPVFVHVELSVYEMIADAIADLRARRQQDAEPCPRCHGTGRVWVTPDAATAINQIGAFAAMTTDDQTGPCPVCGPRMAPPLGWIDDLEARVKALEENVKCYSCSRLITYGHKAKVIDGHVLCENCYPVAPED